MATRDTGGSSRPWVRIIIVTHNAGPFIQACVDAVATQTLPDFEAVIVDNASGDGAVEALRLPDARFSIIRNASNLGFAAASNIGARGYRTPWIATLNPDTVAEPTWLARMHEGVQRHPHVRMFGATLLDAKDHTTIDGFGDALSIAGIAWRRRSGQPTAALPHGDEEAFSPCAAAALYAREPFEQAGGFDESFFCYLEDVDLGFRLRLAGERCVQLRDAIVRHYGSATTGAMSDFSLFHSYRNRLWLLFKDMPPALLLIAVPLNIVCSLIAILKAKLARKGTPMTASLKGLLAGLAPAAVLMQRRAVQSARKVSTLYVARCLVWNLYQMLRAG